MTMLTQLQLVRPDVSYREPITEMMDEWTAAGESIIPWPVTRVDYRRFAAYLADFKREEREPSVAGVMATTYFAYLRREGRMVGAVNIRHSLNALLLTSGGHIGDGVRPSERRKGYATGMIALALGICAGMGIRRVLMTCDRANIGSARSIQKNGGILEDERYYGGRFVQRYWIVL